MATPKIVIREQAGSRTMSYDAGRITASRTFHVWDDNNTTFSATGLQSPADIVALFGTSSTGVALPAPPDDIWDGNYLPNMGDLFPDEADVYAQSYSMNREAGTDHWIVVWTYKNVEVTNSPQPNEAGYVEWTLDINAGFVELFFQGPRYPTAGILSSLEGNNKITTGTQIDVEGVPLSTLRLTTDINISETVESTGGLPAVYANARAARGKRNLTTWYGIEKGKAVYIGCTVRRIGINLYSVQHRIQEATDFHLVQYPFRDSSGRIPTDPINGANRARAVYWRQPFPDFIEFGDISANW